MFVRIELILRFGITAILGIGLLLPGSLAAQDRQDYFWQGFDESDEIRQQAEHALPRMRFTLLNSRYLDKNSLWSAFADELEDFANRYEALRPLILEKSIPEVQSAVAEGLLSYEELVKFYLYRIRLFESDNSRALNAVISIDPKVLEVARLRDLNKHRDPQLHSLHSMYGIPVLLKDNIGFTSMPTTAGALALSENDAPDAFVTEELKAAGAIILGKANLSEWAYYYCDGCPLGYSAMGGQTLNPYGRKLFETGGSSSGSAVAVAANLAMVAIGTETSGSILSPASMNSSVGLKPSTGRVSRTGVVPLAPGLDTVGPIAKTVVDTMIVLNSISRVDNDDSAMNDASDEVAFVRNSNGLQGKRIGYFSTYAEDSMVASALELMDAAGAELVKLDYVAEAGFENFSVFLGGQMKPAIASYLSSTASGAIAIDSIEDIVAFNLLDTENRSPYGQARFESMLQNSFSEDEMQSMEQQLRGAAMASLAKFFSSERLDAIISVNNYHAAEAALANLPALTVPMGFRENGEPVGITFLAPSFHEQAVLDIGFDFEQRNTGRRPPENYQ